MECSISISPRAFMRIHANLWKSEHGDPSDPSAREAESVTPWKKKFRKGTYIFVSTVIRLLLLVNSCVFCSLLCLSHCLRMHLWYSRKRLFARIKARPGLICPVSLPLVFFILDYTDHSDQRPIGLLRCVRIFLNRQCVAST